MPPATCHPRRAAAPRMTRDTRARRALMHVHTDTPGHVFTLMDSPLGSAPHWGGWTPHGTQRVSGRPHAGSPHDTPQSRGTEATHSPRDTYQSAHRRAWHSAGQATPSLSIHCASVRAPNPPCPILRAALPDPSAAQRTHALEDLPSAACVRRRPQAPPSTAHVSRRRPPPPAIRERCLVDVHLVVVCKRVVDQLLFDAVPADARDVRRGEHQLLVDKLTALEVIERR